MTIPDRRACVQHLAAEGFRRAEICNLLHIGYRTIARDRAAIRRGNVLKPDPQLIEQVVGEFCRLADASAEHIRRAVRDSETPAPQRVDAHHRCFQIGRDLVKTLQSLGYLPTAAMQLNADLTHRASPGTADVDDIRAELTRLRQIHDECNPDDQTLDKDFQTFEYVITALNELGEPGVPGEPGVSDAHE